MAEIVLWLFVINLGVTFGAALYEQRIMLPQWFNLSPDAPLRVNSEALRRSDVGRRFWVYVTTIPLTLLTIMSLFLAWPLSDARCQWWLSAAAIVVAERTMTMGYFIPTAVKLMRAESLPDVTVTAMASRWVNWNYARIALTLAGWLAALKALSLLTMHGN